MIKIRDLNELQQDTEKRTIIRDQMANLHCLLLFTLGIFVVIASVFVHQISKLYFENNILQSCEQVLLAEDCRL